MTAPEKDGSEFTEYPDFTVEYRDASHRYWITTADGERTSAISVTSALKVLDKPALLGWAEKCGAVGARDLIAAGYDLETMEPWQIVALMKENGHGIEAKRDAGGDRGTIVHRVLEVYGRDGTIPCVGDFEPEIRGYVQGLCRWLMRADPKPLHIERVLGSVAHGYAGRCDLIAEVNGSPLVVDLKTNPGGRTYDESHLQAAAYCEAASECEIKTAGAVIVAVGARGNFEEVGCDATADDFLSVLAANRAMARLRSLRGTRERAAKAAAEKAAT